MLQHHIALFFYMRSRCTTPGTCALIALTLPSKSERDQESPLRDVSSWSPTPPWRRASCSSRRASMIDKRKKNAKIFYVTWVTWWILTISRVLALIKFIIMLHNYTFWKLGNIKQNALKILASTVYSYTYHELSCSAGKIILYWWQQ